MRRRRVFAVLVPIGIAVLVALTFGSHRNDAGAKAWRAVDKIHDKDIRHDTSKPLRDITPVKLDKGKKIRNEHRFPTSPGSVTKTDPAVQTAAPTGAAPTQGVGFDGMTATDGSQVGMPPDPNAAVGPNDIVEVVNTTFAVYSKTGVIKYGPADTSTLWQGFAQPGDPGYGCVANNDGDATVAYDRIADRFVIQQFEVTDGYYGTGEYLDCVAVSTSGDPTGTWHRYAFGGFGDEFPDYPKLGVWPDGYYTTYNLFLGGYSYDGVMVCAFQRDQMLQGLPADQQCQTDNNQNLNGLLPSDVDSASMAPPAGSPNYLLGLLSSGGSSNTQLQFYKYHVDWSDPTASSFTGSAIDVPAFNLACNGSNCIQQKSVSGQSVAKLDSLGDRLMYRLAYRNFGDHESLLVSHSVAANGSYTGVRWYEIRDPATTPTVYDTGTYAPADSKYRWMGSAAMDKNGDIALGYSISSSSMYPSIAVTGRKAGDTAGQMTLGETILKAGQGSQLTDGSCDPTYCSLRWGDYTSMSPDPTDDCTMWYTNQYEPSSGNFNWHTWIGSFDLCNAVAGGGGGGGGGGANDFSLTANPTALTIKRGRSGSSKIKVALVSGVGETVNLTESGQPKGMSVTLSPTSLTPSATSSPSSTLKMNVGSKTAVGIYTLTVTGTSASATHTVPVTVTVTSGGSHNKGKGKNGN